MLLLYVFPNQSTKFSTYNQTEKNQLSFLLFIMLFAFWKKWNRFHLLHNYFLSFIIIFTFGYETDKQMRREGVILWVTSTWYSLTNTPVLGKLQLKWTAESPRSYVDIWSWIMASWQRWLIPWSRAHGPHLSYLKERGPSLRLYQATWSYTTSYNLITNLRKIWSEAKARELRSAQHIWMIK